MAPKRRVAEIGLTRLDPALDAMRALGFPRKLVREAVKQLLKVYGNEGWVFIEDASYTLLIETLLEKQATMEQQIQDDANVHRQEPSNAIVESAGPSMNAPKRKPCYGWLDYEDGDVDVEPIDLPPVTDPEELKKLIYGLSNEK